MTWPVTDAFREALRRPHEAAYRLQVLERGRVIATLDDVLLDGQVTFERSVVRRQVQLSILDRGGELTVNDARDLLAPYGREVRPWRGVRYGNGQVELVPLGTFTHTVVEGEWPQVRLSGYDRAWRLQQARWEQLYQVTAGTQYVTAIRTILRDRLGEELAVDAFGEVSDTTPLLTYEAQSDPATQLVRMGRGLGMQLYPDQLGTWQLVDEPNPETAPLVDEFIEGPRCRMLNVKRRWDTTSTKNVIVATGEATGLDAPVRGVAEDSDPASPTYVGNLNFGRRVGFYSSPLLTTVDMSQKAARSRLQARLGLDDSLQLDLIPNPALDASDAVRVRRPSAGLAGINELHLVDGGTVPIGRGAAALTTRARYVYEDDEGVS